MEEIFSHYHLDQDDPIGQISSSEIGIMKVRWEMFAVISVGGIRFIGKLENSTKKSCCFGL